MKIKIRVSTASNMKYFGCAKGAIVEVELEDYIRCVVASEIGNANIEACKAQAVACRTFAASRGVLDGKPISDDAGKAQAYIASRTNYANCNAAVEMTKGEVLTYQGKYCTTYFSHSNGGRTYSCKEVWGQDRAYLIARTDEWTKKSGVKRNGHGIGLSQAGTKYAGANGIDYKTILEFYYPGTTLTHIKEPMREDNTTRAILVDVMNRLEKAMKKIKEGL